MKFLFQSCYVCCVWGRERERNWVILQNTFLPYCGVLSKIEKHLLALLPVVLPATSQSRQWITWRKKRSHFARERRLGVAHGWCQGQWVAGLRFRHVASPPGTWTECTAEPEAPGDPRAWGMIQVACVVTSATLLQPPAFQLHQGTCQL